MRSLLVFLLLGVQEPDVRKKPRILDTLEARLSALAPFAADFQFSRTTPDGTSTPGSALSVRVDFPGRRFDTKLTVVDPEKATSFILYSRLDQGRFTNWKEGGDGLRGELGDLFEKVRAACDAAGRELETLLPSTPENPGMALPRGLSLVLHSEPKKGPEDRELGYRVAVSFPGPPGSWLETVRRADDAVMTERRDEIAFRIPSRDTEIVIDRATGLLLTFAVRDYDGATRRIERTRYASGAPPLDLPAPDPKKLRLMSFGEAQGFVAAYGAVIDAAVRRLRAGWARLGDREAKVVDQIAAWAARYLDLLQRIYLDAAADQFIRRRLDAGAGLKELEDNLEDETRAFEDLLRQDDGFAKIARDRLSRMLQRVAEEGGGEGFRKASREGFDLERVGRKMARVDPRPAIRDALRRARQL